MERISQRAGYREDVPSRIAAVAALLAFLLAACGSKEKPPAPGGAGPVPQLDPPQAAEPAAGPPVKGTPPGRLVRVGKSPQGVAIDPKSHIAGVAVDDPPRLVLVDSRSGEKLREVSLPSRARHVSLAASGGPFLVPCEESDQLAEVDPRGGEARVTKVGDNPHDATAIGDRRYTADEFGSTMTVIRDGRVRATVPVDAQPGGIAALDGKLFVNAVRSYTIEQYSGGDRPEGGGSQSSGLGPSHVVAGPEGRIAIGDTRGQALVVYDIRPGLRFRARLPLGGTAEGLAADPGRGRVWITLSERARVVPVDLRPAKPVMGKAVPTARDPLSVAVDTATGRLAVASKADGTLQLVDP
jgi:DNA-binding beta-propeller fold protein YncE